MKSKQPKTLKSRILASMLAIVVLQTCIMLSVFQISDTANQLVQNSVQTFKNSVESKSKEMENQMLGWSDIADFEDTIMDLSHKLEILENRPAAEVLRDSEMRQEFLDDCVDPVLDNLRHTQAIGSFIILEGDGSPDKDAVFLRDVDPGDNSTVNSDILVLAGSSGLMIKNGFTLDSIWTTRLPLPEDSSFYTRPIEAGYQNPNIEAANLSYWSVPFRIREDDMEGITYTRPLMDSEHKCYGVIGTFLSLDYVNKFLSVNAIGIDNTASYYLGMTVDSRIYSTVLVNRNYYKGILVPNSRLTIELKKDSNTLYPISGVGYNGRSLFTFENLRLYNSNTPFEQEQWVLGGLVPETVLYASADRFNLALAISSILAFTIACVGGIIVTVTMVKPLKGLTNDIDTMKPYNVEISKTNICEVDNLVEKIEELSFKVYKSGSKVADILEISPLSLGIFEYEKDSNTVFCTHKLLEMTGITLSSWENNYADGSEFKAAMNYFYQKLARVEDEIDIYHYSGSSMQKWFHIKRVTTERGELQLLMDVTHDMQDKLKIKHDRDYDVLTDLFNRRAFSRMVTDLLEDTGVVSGVLSIWDLDNLKYINDTYGHDMGDKYICLLADVMRDHITGNMIAARMSGDEFMVFLYGQEEQEMFVRLEQIHKSFLNRKMILPDGSVLPVSVSAGMVSITEGNSYDQLAGYADFAMYEVKKSAKGGIKRFDRESHLQNYILVQGVGELSQILAEGRIRYAFQPIVDVWNKEVYGYEALMRPVSDLLGSPADFLRVAEAQFKLNQVETLTWFQSLEQFGRLQGRKPHAKLFVNSIPNQVLSADKLVLLENSYSPLLHNVVMEVTEGAKLNEECEMIKREFCKKWNIQSALDDYGSGYSNTNMLVAGEFDFVKLDMSLIRNIQLYPERQDLVGGMIQYCHSKHIKVIAEGIEIREELAEVMRLGADYVQGYYFSKPGFTADDIPEDKFISI